jgi:uncharacterized membrane protein YheB (UPF0754 family)
MSFFLAWILPVVMGAAIGYVTNDIAIKMLFRPLTEKRLFGIRIPFTPGILPKNRHKLSVSLGNTVSRELLNDEVLRKRFQEPDFRASIRAQVDSLLTLLLDTKLEALRFSSGSPAFERITALLSGLIDSLVSSDGFRESARAFLLKLLDGLGSMKVESFLEGKDSEAVARSILDFILSEEPRENALGRIEAMIDRWEAGEKPLGDFIPFDLVSAAQRIVEAVYPEAFRILMDFLRTPAMKRELAENGRVIVGDLLRRLNAVQRFLVAAAQYDKSIMADMDKTIADLLAALAKVGAKAETRSLLARQVGMGLSEWAGLDPARLSSRLPDYRQRVMGSLRRLADALGEEKGRERLASALAGGVDSLRGRSLESLARETVGIRKERVADFFSSAIRSSLESSRRSEDFARGIGSFIAEFLESHKDRSLSDLFKLSGRLRAEIVDGVSGKAVELISSKTSEILKTVDVKTTVVDKIDSLDMMDVEKIVLDVMKEQFAWINVFGAILGGLIGLVQALLSALV